MIGYSKTDQVGMKKKSQTEKNIDANAELDEKYKEMGTFDICEVQAHKDCFKVAKRSYGSVLNMTYAHRFKRIFYKAKENRHLLSDYHHTVRACLNCHMLMESSAKLTHQVFAKLRPVI